MRPWIAKIFGLRWGALPPAKNWGVPPAKIFDGPGSHFLFLKFLNKGLHRMLDSGATNAGSLAPKTEGLGRV